MAVKHTPYAQESASVKMQGSLALLCAIAVEIVIHDQFIFRAFLFCYVISMGSENLNFRAYRKTKQKSKQNVKNSPNHSN